MTEIIINDNKKIKDVQAEFNEHFPFLKIEFYKRDHQTGEGNRNENKLPEDKTIGEVREKHNAGEISIHGNLKVSSLEGAFHDEYGLNVQVFRKSGELWLQTTTTDEWSLSEQNETAKELSVNG